MDCWVIGSPSPAYSGLAAEAYSGSAVLVTPCSGRSIATTAKPASANESATPNMSSRLRVMPCWKISTGQVVGHGGVAMQAFTNAEFALGTVASTGIISVWVATGTGLKRVTLVLVGSSANGAACQEAVRGAVALR